jgi:hypothetical protein
MIDISEAQYAQGDLVRAAQTIIRHKLTLDTPGAVECERLIREYGEGNRPLWANPNYLPATIYMAQEIVREGDRCATDEAQL